MLGQRIYPLDHLLTTCIAPWAVVVQNTVSSISAPTDATRAKALVPEHHQTYNKDIHTLKCLVVSFILMRCSGRESYNTLIIFVYVCNSYSNSK